MVQWEMVELDTRGMFEVFRQINEKVGTKKDTNHVEADGIHLD